MTPPDRRLAALLAVFAPARARSLASRLAGCDGLGLRPDLPAHSARLASAPRRERLLALAAALAPGHAAAPSGGRGAAARGSPERPRLAALLAASESIGRDRSIAPALARLLRDRATGSAG